MRLHTKLTRLAARRHLSAPDLAAALAGPSASTVRRWLNGQGEPSLSEARRLAELFAVPVDYLADDQADEPDPGLSPEQQELLRAVARLGHETAMARLMLAGPAIGPLHDLAPPPPPAARRAGG